MSGMRVLEWGLRILVGGFFIWSGGMKLPDLAAFTESVGNFQFPLEERIPGEFEEFFEAPGDAYVAYSLPWLELVAGLAVLSGFGKAAGLAILGGLLASFNLALWSAWDRGITDLKCGCHGVSEEPTDFGMKIATNFGWIALIGVIFFLMWRQRGRCGLLRDGGGI